MNAENEITAIKQHMKHQDDQMMALSAKLRCQMTEMRAKNLFLTESLVRLKLWVEEEMGFGSIEQEIIDHIMFSVEEAKDYAEN
jgi:hypothetical protein